MPTLMDGINLSLQGFQMFRYLVWKRNHLLLYVWRDEAEILPAQYFREFRDSRSRSEREVGRLSLQALDCFLLDFVQQLQSPQVIRLSIFRVLQLQFIKFLLPDGYLFNDLPPQVFFLQKLVRSFDFFFSPKRS